MKQGSQLDTHFLSSKHTRKIGRSLRCFFEIDVVQSIYIPTFKEIEYYSVYVFLDHNSPDIMNELLEFENRILNEYPKDGFTYSYLEDEPEKVFVGIRIPIMILNRGEFENELYT